MRPPNHSWRIILYNYSKSKFHSGLMLTLNILNLIILSMVWNHQEKNLKEGLKILNQIISLTYVLEVIIKLMAYGIRYFKDRWNIFDFTIALASIIGFSLEQSMLINILGPISIVRTMRIGRLASHFNK
jgi:voltage-gated sodium channel